MDLFHDLGDFSAILAKIYGEEFRTSSIDEKLRSGYYLAVDMVYDVDRDLKSRQKDEPFNTPHWNSRFALAFILASSKFQHVTTWIFSAEREMHREEILFFLNLLELYSRFVEEDVPAAYLIHQEREVWPYVAIGFNALDDPAEILKAIEQVLTTVSDHLRDNGCDPGLFAFSRDARLRPGAVYPIWVKSFLAYVMMESAVPLRKRVEHVFKEFSLGDLKDADFRLRARAERLIARAWGRRPLAGGHTGQD